MKIEVRHVGTLNREHKVEWPDGWPIPSVGDDIEVPSLPEVSQVRTIVWYPQGDNEYGEPFVYIVVGPRRP